MNQILQAQKDITLLRAEIDKNRQRFDAKIEDLGDKGRGRTESIVELQKELALTNERIMQSRKMAANNSSIRKKIASSGDESPNQIDADVIDEVE